MVELLELRDLIDANIEALEESDDVERKDG